ncbi:CRAL/TRIO domain protein [Cordyceps fumosorosea ARSEF 2679]|uniref:CRAL/TRIO domain protein n=1 Tax=Cordyceps fumosorosea (strain ARSEF 2679) TaxID=1081104 RepID=A0A162JTY3_CORFA|nr:CRAL/TRIO domain protein [Cordyceps fumosorosea ARSEF 2679]OAA73752.1 CRAL/TRIO domain protein [Cordyceps fumosorosea ARSEF 2679]
MTTAEIPAGHLGNLSAEQEKKLQEFWQAIANVSGWSESANGTAKYAAKKAAAPEPEPEQSSGGWGFSMFRKNENADSSGKSAADEDKFGLNKQYNEILAKQSAETIRESIWEMTKHDHPDVLALRFLRARKWNVQQALVMFVAAVHWRRNEMKVDGDIMKNGEAGALHDEQHGSGGAKQVGADFLAQLRMGKSFLHGSDREGRPICVVRVRLHHGGEQSAESIEKYTVHIIETARLLLSAPVETATIIFDMTNFTLSNMDYAPVKFMIKCFEANYPESLGAVLIQNAPWLFQGIWRVIKPWLDPVVAAKVHFTNGRSGLEEFIAPSQIPKELEGDEDWGYKYIEPKENENAAMQDTVTRDSILQERAGLVKQFEEATNAWLRDGANESGKRAREKRDSLATQLKENYWKLDPYIRARSLYDRQGVIGANGAITFYPGAATTN